MLPNHINLLLLLLIIILTIIITIITPSEGEDQLRLVTIECHTED